MPGLTCRTEHMFMAPDRLPIVQEMILAESLVEREEALEKRCLFQKKIFMDLKAMEGFPVTIRLWILPYMNSCGYGRIIDGNPEIEVRKGRS